MKLKDFVGKRVCVNVDIKGSVAFEIIGTLVPATDGTGWYVTNANNDWCKFDTASVAAIHEKMGSDNAAAIIELK